MSFTPLHYNMPHFSNENLGCIRNEILVYILMYCSINSEIFCLFYYLTNEDMLLLLLFHVACSNLGTIFCFSG